MIYKEADESTLAHWIDLEVKLFSDQDPADVASGCHDAFRSATQTAFMCFDDDGKPLGYLHTSIRTDYVEGSKGSPVGFLEALYVEPEYRKRGIATELVRLAEQWAIKRGCREMGSDTELSNTDSQAFHARIGYQEAGRIVSFIKDISG